MKHTKNVRVAFIGSGKVANELALILQFKGVTITGISSRNKQSGLQLAKKVKCTYYENIGDLSADIIFVAIHDDGLLTLAKQLSKDQSYVFTAGALNLKELNAPNWGVFYPMQTFSHGRHLSVDEIPILLEATNNELREKLIDLCELVGFDYALTNSEDRNNYHVAAVFVNNFVNHLIQRAQVYIADKQLNWQLLKPLMEETLAKLDQFSAHEAQTGPAKRGDKKTMENHLKNLSEYDQEIYKVLSKSIQK